VDRVELNVNVAALSTNGPFAIRLYELFVKSVENTRTGLCVGGMKDNRSNFKTFAESA
jgi:hypothetical protein